jgi:hypothetical protein
VIYLLPTAPDEDLHPWVEYYWRLGFSDKDIVEHVLDHFDKSQFGFRYLELYMFNMEA